MKWIDGKEIDIKQFSGEQICEKLSLELWESERSQWLEWDELIQIPAFLIAFDTELTMEGIFTFLENSLGHYAPDIIHAFQAIGDEHDAMILSEICRLACPDTLRKEFLDSNLQEYDISSFHDNHELNPEIIDKIETLESQLYLNTDFDMWSLLFQFLDSEIERQKCFT